MTRSELLNAAIRWLRLNEDATGEAQVPSTERSLESQIVHGVIDVLGKELDETHGSEPAMLALHR